MSFNSRTKISPVWLHFEQIDSNLAKCKICKSVISYKSSTTNLKKHITRKHPTVTVPNTPRQIPPPPSTPSSAPAPSSSSSAIIEGGTDPQNSKIPGVESSSLSVTSSEPARSSTLASQTKMSDFVVRKMPVSAKSRYDSLLLKLFTQDFQPFSVVEDEGFKNFVKALNPAYELPSRKIISKTMIPAKYEECRLKMGELLDAAKTICITTDSWTSRQNLNYLAVTAHFIIEGRYYNVLLDCSSMKESHTINNLASALEKTLGDWKISNRVIFAVSDNAANITGAIQLVAMKSMGCAAHKLNLIVGKATESSDIDGWLKKIKRIVSHFRISTKSSNLLFDIQKKEGIDPPLKLINSVETRWNSTLHMVKRFVYLEVPIKTALALIDTDLPALTPSEWSKARLLCSILMPFEEMTQTLSRQSYPPASSLIVMVRGLKDILRNVSKNTEFAELKPLIELLLREVDRKDRFGSIESSGTLSVCTFLDPRFKMLGFTDPKGDEAMKAKQRVKELLLAKIVQKHPESSSQEVVGGVLQEKEKVVETGVFSSFLQVARAEQQNSTRTRESRAIIELQRYLDDECAPLSENPIEWWHNHRFMFPLLSEVAQERLAITATSVPCEQLFSKAGMILSERRSQLSPEKAKMLLFLKTNEKYFV